MTNPYAKFLGEREPLTVVNRTADQLERLAHGIGDAGLEKPPAPGKWSAREILCHLADCEVVFAFRLRQALAEDYHVIQPFDQDRWASAYAAFDARSALAVFRAVRNWNLSLIRAIPEAQLTKKLTHPERGEMTIQTVVETMAGHDLNHVAQLERIASPGASATA